MAVVKADAAVDSQAAHGHTLVFAAVPFSEWEDILPEWDELLTVAFGRTVFLSPPWVFSWWRHYGGGKYPLLITARDGQGNLRGLAPFYVERRSILLVGGGLKVLRLMGDEGVGSEYLGVLAYPGWEQSFIRGLADRIRGEWALADLRGLRADVALNDTLLKMMLMGRTNKFSCQLHPCSAVSLPQDYQTYLASLLPKFRNVLRHRTNKLHKNSVVRLLRTANRDELQLHLERLFAMHQARWLAEGEAGSFSSPRKRAFYRDISREFLNRGWLRFYHLEVDGVIRASQFGFVFDGVLHSLQEAFDHSFHPPGVGGTGVVLRGLVMERCIAECVKAYDFLGGAEEFKTRWGTVPHYVQHASIGAQGVQGSVAFAALTFSRVREITRERLPRGIVEALKSMLHFRERGRGQRSQ